LLDISVPNNGYFRNNFNNPGLKISIQEEIYFTVDSKVLRDEMVRKYTNYKIH